MSLHFPCTKCANEIAAVDEALGKAVRCSRCQAHVAVPPDAQRRLPKPTTSPEPNTSASDDEFRVNCACGKSIRVPARLAGRQGACPKCKTVFTIPSPTVHVEYLDVEYLDDPPILPDIEAASIWSDDPILSSGSGQVPFDQPQAMSPLSLMWNQPQAMPPNTWGGGQPAQRPFPPQQQQYASRPQSNEPSNVLPILTRACGIAFVVFAVINSLILFANVIPAILQPVKNLERQIQARGVQVDAEALYVLKIILLMVGVCLNAFFGFGAMNMITMRRWGWALAACIMAMLPCSACTIVFTLPIGILGIVLLCLPQVKSKFDQN